MKKSEVFLNLYILCFPLISLIVSCIVLYKISHIKIPAPETYRYVGSEAGPKNEFDKSFFWTLDTKTGKVQAVYIEMYRNSKGEIIDCGIYDIDPSKHEWTKPLDK